MKYYIFKYHSSRGAELYWNGNFSTVTGDPLASTQAKKAVCFNSAREAYDVAGEYLKLQWWQVGKKR